MEVFIKRFTRSVGAKHKTLTRMQKVVKDTPAKCRQKVGDLFTKAKVPCDPKDLPFDLCMDVVEKKSITPAVAYITDPKNKMIPAATLALRIDAQWKVHVNDPSEIFKVFDSKEIIGICGETFKTTWTADYVKQRLGTSA